MTKKIIYILGLLCLLSCGPHRLKCGPGKRCVEISKQDGLKTSKA